MRNNRFHQKNCDNIFMKIVKNGIFCFFLIVLLILFQILYAHQHRITTFHDKTERKWIHTIEQTYELLDGTWDDQIGSSSQAIFGYQVSRQKKYYVAIARRREKAEDVLLTIRPESNMLQESFQFAPYSLQINNNLDFRGVMDLDMDHHQELVVVVNGNYGKRIFIFPLLETIQPERFLMLEIYHRIQFQDLDQDGLTEIMASTEKNGIPQPPSIFHYRSGELIPLKNADFPLLMNQYFIGLQTKKRLYQFVKNPSLQNELLLAEMKYYIAMEDIDQATTQYYTMVAQLPDSGADRKLPIYRGKVLLAYAFLQNKNEAMADTILQEAVHEFLPENTPKGFIQSQFNAEKGLLCLQQAEYREAANYALLALAYNADNSTAKQLQEWLPKQ